MKTYKLSSDAILKMTWLEAGMLRGVLEENKQFDKLPETLRLKLNILFIQAYLNHPTLGKKAQKDIASYEKQLKKAEKKPII